MNPLSGLPDADRAQSDSKIGANAARTPREGSRKNMPLVISGNFAATLACNNLSSANESLQRSLQRLSGGSRITNPADDAGGLAVSMNLSASARRLGATGSTIANTSSFLKTQDGVLKCAGDVLNRIAELKSLYADPTKNSSDRANYDVEYQHLKEQLVSDAGEKFNGNDLFGTNALSVRTDSDGNSSLNIDGVDLMAAAAGGGSGWTERNSGLDGQNIDMAFFNGKFYAMHNTPSGGFVAVSTDGLNWTKTLTVSGTGCFWAAYGAGKVVVGSNWGRVFYSTDEGVTWNESSYGSPAPLYPSYINGRFVGTASGGFSSTDGINWGPGPDVGGSNATDGSSWIQGTQTVTISHDGGNTWTNPATPLPFGPWYKVAYGSGQYVAVASNGTIYSSADGENWVSRTSPQPGTRLNAVNYAAGKFVAAGNGGLILESSDGINWTQQDSGTSIDLGGVAYGAGRFVISGGVFGEGFGKQVVSTPSSGASGSYRSVATTDSLANLETSTLNGAIGDVAKFRAQNGAQQNRLSFSGELAASNKANLELASSRITDVDVAEESTRLARFNILVQAGVAMLAQASRSPEMALRLLAA